MNTNSNDIQGNDTNAVLGDVLLIRYCGWGGHPCDRWMWEAVWEKTSIGYNYGSKKYLIEEAVRKNINYKVLRKKRGGSFVVVQQNIA